MSDSPVERLGSLYLEDMAIIALTKRECAQPPDVHPDLEDSRRARLRSRIKQVSRHDWPANRTEDPLIRRGYTLRQCYRLIVALLLIDAHLAPSYAVALAKANELALLRLIVARLEAHGAANESAAKNDRIAVVLLGELTEMVAEVPWHAAERQRIRLIERSQLVGLWSIKDLAHSGQRLPLDVGTAALAVWHWMTERRLMTGAALTQLAEQLDRENGPEFCPLPNVVPRR